MQISETSGTLFHVRFLQAHGVAKLAVTLDALLLYGGDEWVAPFAADRLEGSRETLE